MTFHTFDVSIYNGNIKDAIGTSIFYTNFTFKLFHVSVAVANIEGLKYYL